jgi:DNA-binding transcriptional MerR regulator
VEELTTAILRRSSDAVVIIGLADGRVLDINEAFFTVTGHARHELVGRLGRDVIVGLDQIAGFTGAEVLADLGSVADILVALWTRSGELRVADLAALLLEVEGRRDALCTIRGVRDPTPRQRRWVARNELARILQLGDTAPPAAATRALEVFGACLRWELGVLWGGGPRLEGLRRVATWPSQPWQLEQFGETAQYAVSSPGMEAVRRVLVRGEPIWIPQALAESTSPSAQAEAGVPMRGWFGFPALGPDGVIGVVEFISREARQPDTELLGMMQDYGQLFGRLLEAVEATRVCLVDEAGAVRPGTREPPPSTVPDHIRDLAGAVAVATEVLERHPTLPANVQSPPLLDELTARIGKLNRLLEQSLQGGTDGAPVPEPAAPSTEAAVEPPPALPPGLTLKAVSRRTGIPAATLRTWEHRYGFMRPRRSPAGYRLYGEEEIARIERVKYLVGQGVRIGAAMKAVIEQAGNDELQQSADQGGRGEDERNAEVYRLTSRSPRGRRS